MPTKANVKGPKRPTPSKTQPLASQTRSKRNRTLEEDFSSSREATPTVQESRTSRRTKPLRPAIPVKQSFAYGSPGKVSLPVRLDTEIRQKPIVEAIEEALEQSERIVAKTHPEPDKSRSSEEASLVGSQTPESLPRATRKATAVQSDEDAYQQSLSFAAENALSENAGINGFLELGDEYDTEVDVHGHEPEHESGIKESVEYERPNGLLNEDRGVRRTSWEGFSGAASNARSTILESVKASGDTILVILLLCLLSLAAMYLPTLGSRLFNNLSHLDLPIPQSPFIRGPNIVDNGLESLKAMTRHQLDSLRHRVYSIESSHDKLAKSLNAPQSHRRINFFATGTGVLVDPYITSPTRRPGRPSLAMRFYAFMTSLPSIQPPGPNAIFSPWDDIGDCWCAANSGGKSQIGILLSRRIIPTDLIIEHIPVQATLDPGATPKDIELWVQLTDAHKREQVANAAVSYLSQGAQPRSDESRSGESDIKEPSARPALDETWVRVGRWQYGLLHKSNIQSFHVDVPMEHFNAPVRKVAIRTLSNWGNSDHVCLYRLKLHGLLAQGENLTSFIS